MSRARRILALCRDCAAEVYGTRAPSPAYAERVALLLAGTAATESHCRYIRQRGFDWGADVGAWGLWQTERAALRDDLSYLARHDALRMRAMAWLYEDPEGDFEALDNMGGPMVLRAVAAWPRLACLMARVHYMRFPEPVPATEAARADYYKRIYNTHLGAGTREKYLADFGRIIAPVLARNPKAPVA